jgi:hypothetical protein
MPILGIVGSGGRKPIVTGGTLYSDATYYYRAFTGNGTLSVTRFNLTADVLVIAGGGGGTVGNWTAGGAGGYRYFSGLTLTPTNYTCTVGAGGAGESGYAAENQAKGVNSSFVGGAISYSSTGGGRASGGSGGSGAGAGGTGNQGGYTPVEGYNGGGQGGAGFGNSSGGAGGAGTNGPYPNTGNGGIGSSAQSSWGAATGLGQNVSGTYYFAGGGGGGNDIYQGVYAGSNGLGKSGPGGGGQAGGRMSGETSWYAAGAGVDGVIIVRYLKTAV